MTTTDEHGENTARRGKPVLAFFLPLLSALAIAVYFVGSDYLLDQAIPYSQAAIACTFFAGLILLTAAALFWPGRIKRWLMLLTRGRDALLLTSTGICFGLGYLLSMLFMQVDSAQNAAVITTLEPVTCITFSLTGFIAAKRPQSAIVVMLMFLVVVAAAMAQYGSKGADFSTHASVVLMVLSVVAFAVGVSIADRMIWRSDRAKAHDRDVEASATGLPITMVALALIIGGLAVMVGSAVLGTLQVTGALTKNWTILVVIAVAVAVSWAFFYLAIARIGIGLTETLYQWKLPFTLGLAWLLVLPGWLEASEYHSPAWMATGVTFLLLASTALAFFQNRGEGVYGKTNRTFEKVAS